MCQNVQSNPHKFLTCGVLKNADILLIKRVQSIYFCDIIEYFANVDLPLPEIVNQFNLKFVYRILLCEGRLSFSCLKIDTMFTILLPIKCYLAQN